MADAIGKFGDVAGAGIASSKTSVDDVPATAGNVSYTYTVPDGRNQQLVNGHIKLTTDATVANRRLTISLKDAANNLINDIHAGAVVAASQTDQHHELMQGVYRETAFIASTLQVPIPIDWVAPAGYKFVVSVDAGVAGDSFSGNLMFKDVS